jgi:cyclopropane fatty-acyl-phospholipid synthase-like methyltransferase
MFSDNEDIKHAVKVFAEEEKGADCDRLLGIANNVLGSLDLRDKVVLDVGSGRGLLSFVAAASGARRVVALEPEAEGSTSGVVDAFAAVQRRLSLNNLSLYGTRLQEYDYAEAPFDIVVLYNSINHIDEHACIKYRMDPASKEIYINLFKKIYQNTRMGGTIVIADCSSRNLFGDIGLRNPDRG